MKERKKDHKAKGDEFDGYFTYYFLFYFFYLKKR